MTDDELASICERATTDLEEIGWDAVSWSIQLQKDVRMLLIEIDRLNTELETIDDSNERDYEY